MRYMFFFIAINLTLFLPVNRASHAADPWTLANAAVHFGPVVLDALFTLGEEVVKGVEEGVEALAEWKSRDQEGQKKALSIEKNQKQKTEIISKLNNALNKNQISVSKLENYKSQCIKQGYKIRTEAFGECILRAYQ